MEIRPSSSERAAKKFGLLPFHTRLVREVCKLARLEDETVGNRGYMAVCFLFLFGSTDKDASSWLLVAHSGRTYQKSFVSLFVSKGSFLSPHTKDRRKIALYVMYDVATFRQM